jgi:hypothetical protein
MNVTAAATAAGDVGAAGIVANPMSAPVWSSRAHKMGAKKITVLGTFLPDQQRRTVRNFSESVAHTFHLWHIIHP